MFEIEDRGPVRRLVITNPDRKNAIPSDRWLDLAMVFEAFEASDRRVLVVTGYGTDFCSGADLAGGDSGGLGVADNVARMGDVARAATALHRTSKPTVAAVDGYAVGAGMNLALGCDVTIATERARFSEVFVRRGLSVDFAGTWLLPRRVGLARAKEIALTGRFVEADEALAIGLVARIVAPDYLEPASMELAERLAAGAPLAQRFIKRALDRSLSSGFDEALEFEDHCQAMCLASGDFHEGVQAFLQKRDPQFEGR